VLNNIGKFNFCLLFAINALIAGCGGGSVDVVSSPLDKYVGTWIGCADHERLTVIVSRSSDTVLRYSMVGEAFNDSSCAGSSVGTMTYSDPVATLEFQSTATILVEDPLTYPVSLLGNKLVDRFRATIAGGTVTYSGPNLSGSCINYQGGNFCTGGSNPATLPVASMDYALYLANGTLTRIRLENGKFVPEEITLTKQ
jgi:hypothetical protein